MSFQAYMTNIEAKTGKSPEQFRELASAKGFIEGELLKAGVKPGQVVDWLKTEHDLGHGHATALVAFFKGKTA